MTQRIILDLYSSWGSQGGIPDRWMVKEIKDQMGKLFYKVDWITYELTLDGFFIGDTIENMITGILSGANTIEQVKNRLKFPLAKKKDYSDWFPIEVLGDWEGLNEFLGLN